MCHAQEVLSISLNAVTHLVGRGGERGMTEWKSRETAKKGRQKMR